MKKRKIIIIVIVVILLLVGSVWFMLPRIKVYKMVKEYSNQVFEKMADETCEYFTDFDITYSPSEPIQTVTHYGITVDIPANWKQKETDLKAFIYTSEDTNETIVIMEPRDLSFYSLLNEEQIADLMTDLPSTIGIKSLVKGFKSLNVGMPDSGYNTEKACLLLEPDSYSVFNVNKTVAHFIMCAIKSVGLSGKQHIIYETDDILALYHVRPLENDFLSPIYADIFSPDDLNTSHTISIRINSYERFYALINSVRLESE